MAFYLLLTLPIACNPKYTPRCRYRALLVRYMAFCVRTSATIAAPDSCDLFMCRYQSNLLVRVWCCVVGRGAVCSVVRWTLKSQENCPRSPERAPQIFSRVMKAHLSELQQRGMRTRRDSQHGRVRLTCCLRIFAVARVPKRGWRPVNATQLHTCHTGVMLSASCRACYQ